jgi:hypothetical protein
MDRLLTLNEVAELTRLRDQCPGDHKYVQHRDGRLPWCDWCQFTESGLHRTQVGLGHAGLRGEED